jgi:hypothetical protein
MDWIRLLNEILRRIYYKSVMLGAQGSVLIKALSCKSESRGSETLWGQWMFSIYLILPAALGLGVYSASNRNKYQKQKINVSRE